MTVFVPVLGMHRSGTSLVAQMLAECGLHLGPGLMPGNASNLSGHWEAEQAVGINDRMLARSGGDWAHPPQCVTANEDDGASIVAFLDSLRVAPVAGWKDPRTTLTFEHWRPHLPAHRIVACLRHPQDVAQSLATRDGQSLDDALALWTVYNERLLMHTADQDQVLWFDFNQPRAWITAWLREASAALGLVYSAAAARQFNEVERHHQAAQPPAGRVGELYRELWCRAHQAEVRASRRPVLAGATAATVEADPPAADDEPIAMAIGARRARIGAAAHQPGDSLTPAMAHIDAQLGEQVVALRKQNALAQQQQLDLHRTREAVHQATAHQARTIIDELNQQWTAAQTLSDERTSERWQAALTDAVARIETRLSLVAAAEQEQIESFQSRGHDQGVALREQLTKQQEALQMIHTSLESLAGQMLGLAVSESMHARQAELLQQMIAEFRDDSLAVSRRIAAAVRFVDRIRKSAPFRWRRSWRRWWQNADHRQPHPVGSLDQPDGAVGRQVLSGPETRQDRAA